MNFPKIVSLYLGGPAAFVKSVTVKPSAGPNHTYYKGQELKITPAILYMLETGQIPQEAIKPILRKLDQLEDQELVELSRLVVPSLDQKTELLSLRRQVYRQGAGEAYTVEVNLGKTKLGERSLVINSNFDLAISDIIYPPFDAPPSITQRAAPNQVKAFEWLISKHLDVFNLIPKRMASGRNSWGAK